MSNPPKCRNPSNATNPNATVLNGSNGSNAAPNGSNGSNANSNHIALSLCFVNLNTINLCNNQYMYDAVTWYSGNLCGDSFLPGGKIADFFGYQYLRDTAPNQADHTTEFVTYSSKAFLSPESWANSHSYSICCKLFKVSKYDKSICKHEIPNL